LKQSCRKHLWLAFLLQQPCSTAPSTAVQTCLVRWPRQSALTNKRTLT
jgi:hypothetical protein